MLKKMTWSVALRLGIQGLLPLKVNEDWLHIEHRDIFLHHLGREMDGLRLVHISDMHFGPLALQCHLRQYIELVNQLEPDFIAITGDFVTHRSYKHAKRARDVIQHLSPRVATLACLGNHDYGMWTPKKHTKRHLTEYLVGQLTEAGVVCLENRFRTYHLGQSALHFVGVGDVWSGRFDPGRAFLGVPNRQANVTLCHNPDGVPALLDAGAKCILAGHTHGKVPSSNNGMNKLLWPTENRQWVSGFYPLAPGKCLYVNRGLGPSRRVRTEHRPEITCLTLRDARIARPVNAARPTFDATHLSS